MRTELEVLLSRIEDEALRADLRRQIVRLEAKRTFGLVFERHHPERVRLPEHPLRVGVTAALKGDAASPGYAVLSIEGEAAIVRETHNPDGSPRTEKELAGAVEETVPTSSLVVLAGFGEPIFPGLRQLASVSRGGEKPKQVVIKGENRHVLETLQFTHAGRIDCIYIDPPYNTGARDWKYDNNYVDTRDAFRHSKWLSFMEKRLQLAKRLLRPEDAVLFITIDDNEINSLGLLLDDVFPACERQMVSITVSPRGKSRDGRLSQVDEYLIIVYQPNTAISNIPGAGKQQEVRWRYLRRNDIESARGTAKGGPNQFYPILVDSEIERIVKIGPPLMPDEPIESVPTMAGAVPVFPIREDGQHMNWGLTAPSLQRALDGGYVRVTPGSHTYQPYTISYLTGPNIKKVESGTYLVAGRRPDGSKIVVIPEGRPIRPTTAWRETRHDAGANGTAMLRRLIPGRKFPFPKSLYAVEDTLRLFVGDKPDAIVLDFFGGSGTTTHAVARLNRQDGGRRRSILVTNNEVSADEADGLRGRGLRPGDADWEALGIFEHITRPRIEAAITGKAPDGEPVSGDYKFGDEFPISEGFDESVEFLELTYLDADDVELDRAFSSIASLLWLRAGACGDVITECRDSAGRRKPYAWTEQYGVLFNPDRWRSFVEKLPPTATTAFIVTDSQTTFTGIAGELPESLDIVRLYENYLTTFAIERGSY